MLAQVIAFELKKRSRLVSTYVYALAFFVVAALFMHAAGGAFEHATVNFGGKILANGPFSLTTDLAFLTYFGVGVLASVMARAGAQDFELGISAMFFTTPTGKLTYFFGRYLGGVLTMIAVYAAAAAGLALATRSPWVDPAMFGPNHFSAYMRPFLVITLVDVLVLGAIFFSVALLTRRVFPVQVASVVLLVGYLVALNIAHDAEHKTIAALVDPFGLMAETRLLDYWSIAEKNTRAVPLEGVLLWNRLIWLGVGAAVIAFAAARFGFTHATREAVKDKKASDLPAPRARPVTTPQHSALAFLRVLPKLAWLELRATTRNRPFVILCLSGALTIFATSRNLSAMYGTSIYPVTRAVLELAKGAFFILMLAITTYVAGELVWRERDAKMSQLVDASPAPTWLLFSTKLLAMIGVEAILMLVIMACGVLVQLTKGYTHLELGLYVRDLFAVELSDWIALAVLALVVQTLVNDKYVGHFIIVIYYVSTLFFAKLGLEHKLYQYGIAPDHPYSDMNGYGHFVAPLFWFRLYWSLCAAMLAVASSLFWQRGVQSDARFRLSVAAHRFSRPARIVVALGLVAFAGTGAFIFYNTNRLNHYRTEFERDELTAQYERTYKAMASDPHPTIKAVDVEVDLHPSARTVDVRGTFTIANQTAAPISQIFINLSEDVHIRALSVDGGSRITKEDKPSGVYFLALTAPLTPGTKTALHFDLGYDNPGFRNGKSNIGLVQNGTKIDSDAYLPVIGYASGAELADDDARKKHGFTPKARMADLDDPTARAHNYISHDGDWIDFETTVSTDPDQIAMAPGYLQREWTENGRRYFHYKMDRPILNFYSFVSARYEVKRDKWNDVAIEIYSHPGHSYNVDGMIAGVKASLDYNTKNFSPYQHRQVRILEIPLYHEYAQSFPNTIPYSEAIGFVAKVDPDDDKDLDYPYYITAHEVSHQWWGHQVVGADAQGSTLMCESLAQYSALMIMKHKYGEAKMRRFLKYELDSYLMNRGFDRKKELPLMRVENQGYIHYRKGGLVMYALADYIGEDKVNLALRNYLKDWAYKGPPYSTARDFIGYLRAVTPPDLQDLLSDWFEHITLYDLRTETATYAKQADGKFLVTLDVRAKKFHAGDLGEETPVPVRELVDIGVFDDKGELLYLKKHKIDGEQARISVVVDREPAKAGVDPLNKLIDRKPDDNSVKVTKSDSPLATR
jgi:hypothetical protein